MHAPAISPSAERVAGHAVPRPVVEACADAAGVDDVDAVLLRALDLTRAPRIAAERGEPMQVRQALLDAYESVALGLCVRPAPPGADDARRTLLHTWTLLRRKRPLAAALIRARVRSMRTARSRAARAPSPAC